tara:strand:+ start:121 stop:561 length:441 start_codon:yes stop_codon:yes gene_type:complete
MKKNTRTTSWTNEDLKKLIQIKNHKIIFDGFEYVWQSKLLNEWEVHYINNFETKNKAFEFLKYNISEWDNELNNRIKTQRKLKYKDLENELNIQEKIKRIADSNIKTFEKIKQIKSITFEITNNELCILLNLNRNQVYKHLKNIEK